MARDSLRVRSEMPELWYQVRKKIGDIRRRCREGVVGPVLQRRVRRHLRQHLRAHRRGLRLRGAEGLRRAHRAGAAARAGRRQGRAGRPAGREDLDRAVATPSWPRSASRWRRCSRRWTQQNAVAAAGFFETGTDRVQLRVTGAFDSVEAIRDFPIRAGDRTFRLGDIADGAARLRRSRRAAACASWARTRSASRWR